MWNVVPRRSKKYWHRFAPKISRYVCRVSLPISESLFTQATVEQMYDVARVISACMTSCVRIYEERHLNTLLCTYIRSYTR